MALTFSPDSSDVGSFTVFHSNSGRRSRIAAIGRAALLGLAAACAPAIAAAQTPATACGAANGQSVAATGRVLDPASQVVSGATVIVECAGATIEATTDSAGRYTFNLPPGSYNVHVHRDGFAPGFAALDLRDGQPADLDVRLGVPEVSEAVTVTAAGFEQLVKNAPASVTVLPREELQTRRIASVAQALVDVEGVDVGQNVGKTGGLTISMRGMPSDYTLILIDGRRQNPAGSVTPNGFGETSTSFMPPLGAIDRIEVVRGPMSTLYGSDAMGGVVNIITRRVSEAWSASVTADGTLQGNSDYGNTGQGNVYFSGPLVANRLGLAARGNMFHREAAALQYEDVDGELVPITSFGSSPTRADVRTAGGRLTFLPRDNHELYLDVDGAWQSYDNSARQLGTLGVQGGYQEELRFNRQQFVLSYTARLGIGVLESAVTQNTTETIGRTIPPGTPGREAGNARTLEATNKIVDGKLIAPLGRHMLSVGGQWWDADMVDAVAPAPYAYQQGALFAEDEWRLLAKLGLTLGLRYDNHSTFGGNASPRAYLVYNLTPSVTLKGGVSRGFKTPQLNQLASGIVGFGAQGTLPLIGSPGLKPETSTSTEAAAYFTLGAVSFNLTAFNNEFQDKIASGPGIENCSFRLSPNRPGCVDYGEWPNVDLFGQSINVDEAVTRGIEASMRLPFLGRWDLSHNYTYTDSEQRSGAETGQPLVNTPRHMYNANLRFAATSKLSTWLRAEARSSRTRGTSATARAATEQIGPFKSYALAHLGAGYQLTRTVTLNATIYNLFDTDFLTFEPYVYNNATVYASQFNNLQEPRRLWLSVNYSF